MSNFNISFFDSYIDPSAKDLITDVLESGRLSEGPKVKEFEETLEKELGLRNVSTVNSGTSALHSALVLADIGPGDEVILPAQTFVASGLTIIQQGAVPVFADIDYATGNISPTSVSEKITERTKAVMVVHWGGQPVDLDEICKIARENNLVVIEDAAHAIGASYKNQPIGSISDYTCFSFQAIKHLTTGDGGAICTIDPEKANRAKTIRWFGIDRANAQPSELGERIYDISSIGFKYHLNDYAATLGLANLPSLKSRIQKRANLVSKYRVELENVTGITLFNAPEDRQSAHWLFGVHIEDRKNFIRALKEKEIPTSVVHVGIDRNSVFGEGIRPELINQRKFDETQIHLPIHDGIGEAEIEFIIETIKQGW